MTTTTTRRTCDCDHGEWQNGPCGAVATKRHRCAGVWIMICDPCNAECHNRGDERWA